MKTTSIDGVKMIAGFEGTILHLYKDVAGIETVCTGHVTLPGEDWSSVTREKCEFTLGRDLSRFEARINETIKVATSQPMFDAMVSLSFNIGTAAFKSSSVARLLNEGLYSDAADAFSLWRFAQVKQKDGTFQKQPVLQGRRLAEASVFRSGILEAQGARASDGPALEDIVRRAQGSLFDLRGLIDGDGLPIEDTTFYAEDGRIVAEPPEAEEPA